MITQVCKESKFWIHSKICYKFTYKAMMHRLKRFFSQSALLFNNLVLRSYLTDVLLRIKVFLVMETSSENINEKKKIDRRKTLKSEEKEKRIIWGKSNNNNIHLYWFQIIFCSKTYFEKKFFILYLYTMKFYLQFLCVTGCLKHSKGTLKLNIHKYTNYNMIKYT